MGFWKKYIHRSQEIFFEWFIISMYVAYIAIAIGLLPTFPLYLTYLNNFIHIYICLFILYRFNPFRHVKFSELDRKIVFSSGLILFTTFILDSSTFNWFKQLLKL
jgi:hypothetical protein